MPGAIDPRPNLTGGWLHLAPPVPNPTRGPVTLSYQARRAGTRAWVVDATGRLIARLEALTQEDGHAPKTRPQARRL